MGRKKKLFETNNETNETVVNDTEDKYSDFIAEDVVNSVNYDEYFSNDLISDYGSVISNFIETETNEVVLPVKCKIGKDQVVVDYKGFGLVVNVADSDVNKVTLKIYGDIGNTDFRYEVL